MPDIPQHLKRFTLSSADISFNVVAEVSEEVRRTGKDFSKPVMVKQITLMTDIMQRLFTHYHVRLDYSLFLLTKVQRQQGRNAEALKVEEALQTLYNTFGADIQRTLNELDTVVKNKKLPDLHYDHAREFEAPVRTGFSHLFITLTLHLDRLISLIETLELACEVSPAESSKLVDTWVKRYRSFCHSINSMRSKILPRKPKGTEHTDNESVSSTVASTLIQTPPSLIAENNSVSPHR